MIKSVTVFVASLIFIIILFILIFKYIIIKNTKLNYGKHNNFEVALMNYAIYIIISSLLIMLYYLLYNNKFFEHILSKVPHNKEFLDSGLFTGLALILVGILIKCIYFGFLKIIHPKVIMIELEENEQTWVIIVGCILLFVVGLKNEDFIFAFSVLSLIIAYFFWVINNDIKNIKEKIQKLFSAPRYIYVFVITVLIISALSLFIPECSIEIIWGSILGFAVGLVMCVLFYKKISISKKEESEMGMELKFRAWDKNKQIMDYINDLYWFNEKGIHNSNGENGSINYIFMTYSGLNDSKRTNEFPEGQEVYEGDIVMDLKGNIYKVTFLNGKFIADAKFGIIGRKDLELAISEKAYVVGNIYEKDTLKF